MSTNISKVKREELLRQVAEIRSKLLENKDENTEKLLVYLSNIEKDIDGKKYGLVFEEHREAVDELLECHVPVLVEDESLKIDNGGQQNFIIEGDNLASLKLLEKTHKGKIDFIYIDPPYNTGNKDFIYGDEIIDSSDKFKHSKWLSFLNNRLKLAQKLLSKNGLIYISIDDNEIAQLKLLCDSIFGEDNFIAQLIWKKKQGGGNDSVYYVVEHEYILCYAKDIKHATIYLDRHYELDDALYPFTDELGDYGLITLDKSSIRSSDSLIFEIKGPDGKIYYPRVVKGKQSCWRWSKAKVEAEYDSLVFKNGKVYTKYYRPTGVRPRSLLIDSRFGRTETGKEQIKRILENSSFTYPKPSELIRHLLETATTSNDYVLDFFAGSGTTGEAVMQLNAEDGGNRKFILCTNNENNICRDVTYERIKRVIAKEDYKASLKYYKVDFVPISEQVYYEYADKLLLHIKELVELENGLDFDGNKKVAICLTDEDLQDFVNSLGDTTTYKSVYVGHDVFVTPEIESKLNTLGIKINIIPDYYYGELRG